MGRHCWYEGNLHIFVEIMTELLSKEQGMTMIRCSEYHFQLKGGLHMVNAYPTAGTFYVQGTNGKGYFSKPEELIVIAKGGSDKHMVHVPKGNRFKQKTNFQLKKKLWKSKTSHNCYVCGKPVETFEVASLEHKIPLSKGGSNRGDNLTISHRDCNTNRGNKLTK